MKSNKFNKKFSKSLVNTRNSNPEVLNHIYILVNKERYSEDCRDEENNDYTVSMSKADDMNC